MKNYLFLTVCVVGMLITVKAQNNIADTVKQFNIVYLPNYYKAKGIIFSKDYKVGIEMKSKKYRYIPTKEDLIKAEEIFNKQYNQLQKTNVDTKKIFCHWVRQYVGVVDSNGNKNIIVQLINNSKPRKIKHLLGKDWERIFIIMLADSFYSVSTRFKINIDTGEMTTEL